MSNIKKNHITVFNIDEEGRFGGPEKRIVQVALELKKYNIHTTIICPIKDSKIFIDFIKKNKISYVKMNITRLSKHWLTLLRYSLLFPVEVFYLSKFLYKSNIDIVHINGSYQFKSAIASIIARKKIIWHLNDTNTIYFIKMIFKLLSFISIDGFIIAGDRVKNYYLKDINLKNRPIEKIHAPVDTNLYNSSRRDFSSNKLLITTLSGINQTKAPHKFINLCETISTKYDHIDFKVAGLFLESQKGYASYIKKLVNDSKFLRQRLELLGFVRNVPELLSKSDICIFTSLYEASPTSIWEAMAAGKAIVTTDVGSVSEYITDGVSGFIVPVDNHNELLNKTIKLIENKSLRIKMGDNAREIAFEKLNITLAAEKHASIYNEIIEQ